MALATDFEYGNGTQRAGTAATADDGVGDFAGSDAVIFTWDRAVKLVTIHLRAGEAATFYVKWNSTTNANATTNCDMTMTAGQTLTNPSGMVVSSVAIYSSAAETYQDDFYINGWR